MHAFLPTILLNFRIVINLMSSLIYTYFYINVLHHFSSIDTKLSNCQLTEQVLIKETTRNEHNFNWKINEREKLLNLDS